MTILISILLPMLVGSICFITLHDKEDKFYLVTMLTNVVVFVVCLIGAILPDTSISIAKICDLGINLEIDGFRKIYSLIISFMWMLTMLLSYDYFKHHHNLARYYFFNLMTLGATLGVFMASDFFTAFVFFEIMSFTSFPWVIQEETDGAIRAANTYLAVAVIGGLTALMGIFIIYFKLGTVTLSEIYPLVLAQSNKAPFYVAASCILFGFGAKAGMFPLHIWLPKAHPVAPAPASALLSGVLTKSGIFGIIAISVNIFRYDVAWGNVILILGTITMFLGALLALFSIDLKRTLACSSMSQVGFILVAIGMLVLLGEENALAARGAILHMMNHSLFKLVLFMSAGVVYMNTHKLNLNEIKGFGRNKPVLMICFLLAAAGIAGIPGLNGYVSKTLIHEAIVEGVGEYGYLKLIEWIFLISGGLTLAYMTKLFICVFVKKNDKYQEKKKYMSISSYIALLSSAILLPVLGLNANRFMVKIADFTMPFFNGAHLHHELNFYSLENLKGGIISIVIGVLVYIFVVNKFMIKDGEYVDLWPKNLDLEDLVYRPILLEILPNFFGDISRLFAENMITVELAKLTVKVGSDISKLFADNIITVKLSKLLVRISGIISHFFSDSLDLVIYGLRLTVYKSNKIPTLIEEEETPSYMLGNILDKLFKREDEHYYADKMYSAASSKEKAIHKATDNLSFALLAMGAGMVLMMIYIFMIHKF